MGVSPDPARILIEGLVTPESETSRQGNVTVAGKTMPKSGKRFFPRQSRQYNNKFGIIVKTRLRFARRAVK
jgi:hypothetical protein